MVGLQYFATFLHVAKLPGVALAAGWASWHPLDLGSTRVWILWELMIPTITTCRHLHTFSSFEGIKPQQYTAMWLFAFKWLWMCSSMLILLWCVWVTMWVMICAWSCCWGCSFLSRAFHDRKLLGFFKVSRTIFNVIVEIFTIFSRFHLRTKFKKVKIAKITFKIIWAPKIKISKFPILRSLAHHLAFVVFRNREHEDLSSLEMFLSSSLTFSVLLFLLDQDFSAVNF